MTLHLKIRCLAFSIALLAMSVSQSHAAWNVINSPARFVVELDSPDKPAKTAFVKLAFPDPEWANAPIRVYNEAGAVVGSEILWKEKGEVATLIFDASGTSKKYYVYLGCPDSSPKANWESKGGVILETREGEGKTLQNLGQLLDVWNKSAKIFGRSISDSVYTGGHLHGPQKFVLSRYRGWFEVTAPGKYRFATISTDASFVLVDGKEVVSWPGHHHFYDGRWGKFQASVDLSPGLHSLEFYNNFHSAKDRWPLLCALSVKAGDQAPWIMLMSNNNFFLSTGKAHVVQYELNNSELSAMTAALNTNAAPPAIAKAPNIAFEWEILNQSIPTWDDYTDIGCITVQFRTYPISSKGTYVWTFDDKTTAEGIKVDHIFLRPGLRTVKLTLKEGNSSLGEVSIPVNIRPSWPQMIQKKPEIDGKHRDYMLTRLTQSTPSDFSGIVALFSEFEEQDSLLKIWPVLKDRLKDFPESDMGTLLKTAQVWGDNGVRDYEKASQLLQLIVGKYANSNVPATKALLQRARLDLAKITLQISDKKGEVKTLLEQIDINVLSNDERRILNLIKADLTLANGDINGAKQQYAALTGEQGGIDSRSSIRRTAKIDQANAFVRKKEFDAADRLLDEIEWQTPVEKLASDFILSRLKLLAEWGDKDAAYYYAKRHLPVITSAGFRSEILLLSTEIAYSHGDNDWAKKNLKELMERYPYSEATAQAKTKWKQEMDSIR